jgi:basic amino acid/polyamine antiporter, APA family
MEMGKASPIEPAPALKRRLGLPLLVLYGTGITVGAGIYVLIGAVAGHAGIYTPWSFVLAGTVMAFTVASYAELATRFPVSAGEAVYVGAAFQSRWLSTLTGLLTIVIGVVSSSAVTLGSAGYIQQFVDLPQALIVVVVLAVLAAVAAWGILESVLLASVFTLIEVGGLVIVIVAALHAKLPIASTLANLPPLEVGAFSGIAVGSLLAFFAFIGFEDLANVVEEAKDPHRNIPRAMVLTLLISTILYVAVAAVAIAAVSVEQLSSSSAPLSLVFQEVAGISPATISAIAIVATLNTILAQMTMAARVIYGMARQGDFPDILARVHPRTGTPLVATALIVASAIPLALLVPLEGLAESTSLATLVVFALVNLALLRLRYRRVPSNAPHVRVPIWMPVVGLASCAAMIASALLR